MHNSLKPFLVLLNILGLLPVEGVTFKKQQSLQFSSLKMCYTLLMISVSIVEMVIIVRVSLDKIIFSKLRNYIAAFLGYFCWSLLLMWLINRQN